MLSLYTCLFFSRHKKKRKLTKERYKISRKESRFGSNRSSKTEKRRKEASSSAPFQKGITSDVESPICRALDILGDTSSSVGQGAPTTCESIFFTRLLARLWDIRSAGTNANEIFHKSVCIYLMIFICFSLCPVVSFESTSTRFNGVCVCLQCNKSLAASGEAARSVAFVEMGLKEKKQQYNAR